uniref:Uncharacterized protein n=1 Tax=Phytophthora ramorum TaxID=164328 RepID=H3H8E1_PHYRM
MAPTGTSGPPASSAQTPSASPGDGSPSGGDVAGESPSVPSPTPPPVDDEEEEVEEELPEEEEAPDDAADESMDAPSGRSSAQTPSRLLLLDRALALQGESTLPSGRDIRHDRQLPAPARYEVPPEHTSGRQVRLVGVPATENHNDGKTFTQNGYGGLEALMQMNELTIGSLAQLHDFFDENVDIHDYVLTPRKKPLSEDDMEHQLGHVGLKREIASILTEFGPENLAQRVFGLVDVLQKVMARYRRMREQVDDSSSAMLMRSGVGYSGAVELLDQDQVLHTKFPLDPLLEMLVRMMFWNKLDETPWTKHVPRHYFRAARAKLDDYLEDDVRPPVWDALMGLDQEEEDLIPEVFEPEVDDKTKDGDFVPGEEFELPEDEVIPVDESPPKRTRQKSKRRRTSSSISGSTPSKKPKRSKRRNDLSATVLARKDFESLTSLENTVIETPGPSITSWMHLGIRVKRGDPTTLSALQTPGFPDYAPNRFDLDLLKERCDGQELGAFLNTMPWRKMFDERPRELYFHKREDLDDEALNALDDWMDFVCGNFRAIWDILHWLTLDRSSDAPPGSIKIQTKRARRHEGFRKKALALQKKLSTKLPSTIWNEPGVWKFPNKICHWILMDKQHFRPGTSECYSLQEQMELLDRREPARAQWSFCSTDAERIAHLPENVRRGLIPADERDPVTDIFS